MMCVYSCNLDAILMTDIELMFGISDRKVAAAHIRYSRRCTIEYAKDQ